MLKMKTSVAAILATVFVMAGCGALSAMAPVPAGAATSDEVDEVLRLCTNGMNLVQTSEMQLARAVLAKEEFAKLDAQVKAAKATGDLKEKEAKLNQAMASVEAALAAADFEKAATNMKAESDAKKRENVGNAIYNLAWATHNDKMLVGRIAEIVKKPPNPTMVGKLDSLRSSGQMMGDQIVSLGAIVSKSKSLLTVVGVSALPTSASDEPRPVQDLN
jgi:hypothetical protein